MVLTTSNFIVSKILGLKNPGNCESQEVLTLLKINSQNNFTMVKSLGLNLILGIDQKKNLDLDQETNVFSFSLLI